MSEMVDKVAKALHDVDPTIWVGEDQSRYFKQAARAAIAAMREPTKEMWDACHKAQADFETGIGWQVMIDAALAEPEPDQPHGYSDHMR
jgi:hypothetical protein